MKKLIWILTCISFVACEPTQQIEEKAEPKDNENELNLFLPGKLSTNLSERDLAISPDGWELFFTIQTFKREKSIVFRMIKTESGWSEPITAPFSGVYKDLEPAYSPNGNKLYFASDRPLADSLDKKDYDIWFVNKTENGWSNPIHTGDIINTSGNEFYPSVVSDGSIYFTASYADAKGTEDIYYSRYENGVYTKPVSLDSTVNTKTYEFNAYVAPDESFMLFSSFGREDGMGGGDLYISLNKKGKWQQSINLGNKINSKGLDYCPFVSSDGKTLYFTSNRSLILQLEKPVEYVTLRDLLNQPDNGFDNVYEVDFEKMLNSLKVSIDN